LNLKTEETVDQRKLLIRENYYGINDNPNHNRFPKLFLKNLS